MDRLASSVDGIIKEKRKIVHRQTQRFSSLKGDKEVALREFKGVQTWEDKMVQLKA